jgi:hypothetical protein
MKKEQILEVCQMYDELLECEGFVIKHRDKNVNDYDMNHIRWMVSEIVRMVEIPCKLEKVNRWIGFVQGVLWIRGYYSIDEMKGHNLSGNECKEDVFPKPDEQYYWFEGGFEFIN